MTDKLYEYWLDDLDPSRVWRAKLSKFIASMDESVPEWDDYFHAIAEVVALHSKDPKHKVEPF